MLYTRLIFVIFLSTSTFHFFNFGFLRGIVVLSCRVLYNFYLMNRRRWCNLSIRSEGTTLLKYKIPTRGLLGLRNSILTASRGTAILNTIFDSYGPWGGDISTRDLGSLVISHLEQSPSQCRSHLLLVYVLAIFE